MWQMSVLRSAWHSYVMHCNYLPLHGKKQQNLPCGSKPPCTCLLHHARSNNLSNEG